MPEYPFRCECGHTLSWVSTAPKTPPLIVCPKCGKEMKRVFTPPAVRPWGVSDDAT